MECFRIDESGYTGFDLLNADQRFQGASAIAISDDSADRLIREHFPKLHASELKYRALSRRVANHPRLLGLLRDLHTQFKCVTYVCDKRYLLALMFIDYAVEPFYYQRDFDLYKDGRNYGMASLLYRTGPTFLSQAGYDTMLAAFQRAIKEKSYEALGDLVQAVRRTNWRELEEILGPLGAFAAPECLQAIATPGLDTDAALVVLQSLISRMEVMSEGPYRVEHDQSKNLTTYHALIQRFIDHDAEVEFRVSEIASLKFPLKLAKVSQVDSKTSPAIQVADVMIGAAIEAGSTLAGQRSGGLDPEAVLSIYREGQLIHLMPSLDFEEQRRFRADGQSSAMIDYLATHLFHPGDDRTGGRNSGR